MSDSHDDGGDLKARALGGDSPLAASDGKNLDQRAAELFRAFIDDALEHTVGDLLAAERIEAIAKDLEIQFESFLEGHGLCVFSFHRAVGEFGEDGKCTACDRHAEQHESVLVCRLDLPRCDVVECETPAAVFYNDETPAAALQLCTMHDDELTLGGGLELEHLKVKPEARGRLELFKRAVEK